jgi:protein-S-isoprenylcysteine O-methyltransferase Ste14
MILCFLAPTFLDRAFKTNEPEWTTMNSLNENIYRLVFGVLWVVYFALRLYFQRRVKGMGTYTLVNARQEKSLFRLFALAYMLLPLYFLTPWLDFARLPFPAWLRWAGTLITLLGISLFGWAHQALGMNWTAVLALSEKQTLVTAGPYRLIRHPMYTAFLVIGIGFLLLSANVISGGVYLLPCILMMAFRLPAEERMLQERFGEQYRLYAATTGSLLPRLIRK